MTLKESQLSVSASTLTRGIIFRVVCLSICPWTWSLHSHEHNNLRNTLRQITNVRVTVTSHPSTFLWMGYIWKAWREFHKLRHKRSLEQRDTLIRLWWSEVKAQVTMTSRNKFLAKSKIHMLIMIKIHLILIKILMKISSLSFIQYVSEYETDANCNLIGWRKNTTMRQ